MGQVYGDGQQQSYARNIEKLENEQEEKEKRQK